MSRPSEAEEHLRQQIANHRQLQRYLRAAQFDSLDQLEEALQQYWRTTKSLIEWAQSDQLPPAYRPILEPLIAKPYPGHAQFWAIDRYQRYLALCPADQQAQQMLEYLIQGDNPPQGYD